MLGLFMNTLVATVAIIGTGQEVQKQNLGQFNVVEAQLKERFAGKLHRHVCETLKLEKDGKMLLLELPCRKEFRKTKAQPSFHQGEPILIIGFIDSTGLHAELPDIKPVLPPHRHG